MGNKFCVFFFFQKGPIGACAGPYLALPVHETKLALNESNNMSVYAIINYFWAFKKNASFKAEKIYKGHLIYRNKKLKSEDPKWC